MRGSIEDDARHLDPAVHQRPRPHGDAHRRGLDERRGAEARILADDDVAQPDAERPPRRHDRTDRDRARQRALAPVSTSARCASMKTSQIERRSAAIARPTPPRSRPRRQGPHAALSDAVKRRSSASRASPRRRRRGARPAGWRPAPRARVDGREVVAEVAARLVDHALRPAARGRRRRASDRGSGTAGSCGDRARQARRTMRSRGRPAPEPRPRSAASRSRGRRVTRTHPSGRRVVIQSTVRSRARRDAPDRSSDDRTPGVIASAFGSGSAAKSA